MRGLSLANRLLLVAAVTGALAMALGAALFALAALAEIGGAWLVWQGVREHRGWLWIGAGVLALVHGATARRT